MTVLLFAVLLLGLVQEASTLASELRGRNLPIPPDAADIDHPIASYEVLDDAAGFVIGYYTLEADKLLHDLRVRSYDRQTATWRFATFDAIGSVVSIKRHAGLIYVTGHSSPSAAPLLVLFSDLRVKQELDGWIELLLEDGRVVFTRSMRHFMPAHAETLAIYDPRSDSQHSLFPPGVRYDRGSEHEPGSDLMLDRSIGTVEKGKAAGTIQFEIREQKRRVTRGGSETAGPEERFTVTCNISSSMPSCRKHPLPPRL